MRRLFFFIPVIAMIVSAVLFFRGLNGPAHNGFPSALIGRPAPALTLPALDRAAKRFTSADLRAGHVTVVNVWASWCLPCRAETAQLTEISRYRSAELYGIVYEDSSGAAREFLKEMGDPFARLDLDADGHAGVAWGIYGVPETFVIDRKGIVRLRYAGPIVPGTLAKVILPAIASAQRES